MLVAVTSWSDGGRRESGVSGEVVLLESEASGRIAAYIRTLARLPAEPKWVLVGGLAVNVRLRRVHRATNDVDTVSSDQPRLVEILVGENADRLSPGKLQFHDPDVEVDVMESTEGSQLPMEEGDRAFALARRWTMGTATEMSLQAVDSNHRVIAETELLVAARPALIALKAVSIPRRVHGSYPEKIGSDIQDLYRLVASATFDELVAAFRSADSEVVEWVSSMLARTFASGTANLRYSLARLRRFTDNPDGRMVEEDDLALLGELGRALAGED